MNVNVEHKKFVSETIILDIQFPYYGWWSSKKDGIIKMYPEYYQHDKAQLRYIVVVKIKMGFGIDTEIRKEYLHVSQKNVVAEEFEHYLRDYADKATEKEFNAFRFKALDDLK